MQGHGQYTKGQLYNSDGGAIANHIWFNGCMHDGSCGTGGGDAPGFGANPDYSYGLNGVYGAGHDGVGGAEIYWGNFPAGGDLAKYLPYAYYWRDAK